MGSDDQTLEDSSQDAFRDRIAYLQTWAAIAASRARDLTYEWPAVACAFTALYLLFVVPQTKALAFIDIVVIVGVLGTGCMLGRFEYNSRAALSRLVKQLATDDDSPTQSSEKSHERY